MGRALDIRAMMDIYALAVSTVTCTLDLFINNFKIKFVHRINVFNHNPGSCDLLQIYYRVGPFNVIMNLTIDSITGHSINCHYVSG